MSTTYTKTFSTREAAESYRDDIVSIMTPDLYQIGQVSECLYHGNSLVVLYYEVTYKRVV